MTPTPSDWYRMWCPHHDDRFTVSCVYCLLIEQGQHFAALSDDNPRRGSSAARPGGPFARVAGAHSLEAHRD